MRRPLTLNALLLLNALTIPALGVQAPFDAGGSGPGPGPIPGVSTGSSPPSTKSPSANPFTDYCAVRSLSPTACGNKFFSADAGPKTWAGQQAAANCAAEADQRTAEVAAIYRWLGTDVGDMMWYASGGPDGFSVENKRKGENPSWWWDPAVQRYYKSVHTPNDRSAARDKAQGMAHAVDKGLEISVKIEAPLVSSAAGGIFSKAAAAAAGTVTGWMGSFSTELNEFFSVIEKNRAQLAYEQPWTIGGASTGIYYAGDSFGTAPDGSTFPVKPSYPPPGTPGATDGSSGGPVSSGSGSSSESGSDSESSGSGSDHGGSTPPSSSSSNDHLPDPDEIVVSNPWIRDDSGIMPGEPIARPVMDPPDKSALERCIEREEKELLDELGTKDISAWYDIPKTEAEIKAEQEQRLKNGACDKVYWGEEYCRKWKIHRDSEELPPDMQRNQAMWDDLRRATACPPNVHPERETFCHHVQQEILKRYALDEYGAGKVKAAFGPVRPEEMVPPNKAFPPLPKQDFGTTSEQAVAGLIAKNGQPPKRSPVAPSTPFTSPPIPASGPPRLPHGGIGLAERPSTHPASVLDDLKAKLGAGGFGGLPKPSGWNDGGFVWPKPGAVPGSGSGTVADQLKKLKDADAKARLGGKPPGWTAKQWRDFQELLRKAGAVSDEGGGGAGHDEL